MFETDIGETSKFRPRLYARAQNSTYSWAPPLAVCEAQAAGLRPNSPLASGPDNSFTTVSKPKKALIFTDSIFQFHFSSYSRVAPVGQFLKPDCLCSPTFSKKNCPQPKIRNCPYRQTFFKSLFIRTKIKKTLNTKRSIFFADFLRKTHSQGRFDRLQS